MDALPVGKPPVEEPACPRERIAGVRGKEEPALRARRGEDPLGEPLPAVGHEPGGTADDLRWAAVVRDEVDPAESRQEGHKAEDAADVRETPGVDRLVVVPDDEEVALLSGEEEGEVELGAVEILRLVEEEDPAARTPASEERGVRAQRGGGTRDELVQVEEAAPVEEGAIGGPRRPEWRVRGGPLRIEGEAREAVLEAAPGSGGERCPGELVQEGGPVRDRRHVPAGVTEDLPSEGVEGADPHRPGPDPERREGRLQPLPQLDGREAVEGEGADRRRVRPVGDPPRDPRDDRRRLPRPCRGDAQDRSRGCRGGGALVRGEGGEAGAERAGKGGIHGAHDEPPHFTRPSPIVDGEGSGPAASPPARIGQRISTVAGIPRVIRSRASAGWTRTGSQA